MGQTQLDSALERNQVFELSRVMGKSHRRVTALSAAVVIDTRDCPENAAEELAVCLARAAPNCRKVIFENELYACR